MLKYMTTVCISLRTIPARPPHRGIPELLLFRDGEWESLGRASDSSAPSESIQLQPEGCTSQTRDEYLNVHSQDQNYSTTRDTRTDDLLVHFGQCFRNRQVTGLGATRRQ